MLVKVQKFFSVIMFLYFVALMTSMSGISTFGSLMCLLALGILIAKSIHEEKQERKCGPFFRLALIFYYGDFLEL